MKTGIDLRWQKWEECRWDEGKMRWEWAVKTAIDQSMMKMRRGVQYGSGLWQSVLCILLYTLPAGGITWLRRALTNACSIRPLRQGFDLFTRNLSRPWCYVSEPDETPRLRCCPSPLWLPAAINQLWFNDKCPKLPDFSSRARVAMTTWYYDRNLCPNLNSK